jgi:hypothetical protein
MRPKCARAYRAPQCGTVRVRQLKSPGAGQIASANSGPGQSSGYVVEGWKAVQSTDAEDIARPFERLRTQGGGHSSAPDQRFRAQTRSLPSPRWPASVFSRIGIAARAQSGYRFS